MEDLSHSCRVHDAQVSRQLIRGELAPCPSCISAIAGHHSVLIALWESSSLQPPCSRAWRARTSRLPKSCPVGTPCQSTGFCGSASGVLDLLSALKASHLLSWSQIPLPPLKAGRSPSLGRGGIGKHPSLSHYLAYDSLLLEMPLVQGTTLLIFLLGCRKWGWQDCVMQLWINPLGTSRSLPLKNAGTLLPPVLHFGGVNRVSEPLKKSHSELHVVFKLPFWPGPLPRTCLQRHVQPVAQFGPLKWPQEPYEELWPRSLPAFPRFPGKYLLSLPLCCY